MVSFLFNVITNKMKKTKRCIICNKKGTDVHHIYYNKKNCKESNLITLCNDHNTKANYNRNFWKGYIEAKFIDYK